MRRPPGLVPTRRVKGKDSASALNILFSLVDVGSNECADAIAKHQAIQDDDNPADTAFPCVNLEGILPQTPPGLPLRKLPAPMQAHRNTPLAVGNSPALKLKHFSNLHDALRTHMLSKPGLGKANTETGYYSYNQSLLPTVHKRCPLQSKACSTL
eukprot:1147926-Pelagomonas_calceolata.AAC.2